MAYHFGEMLGVALVLLLIMALVLLIGKIPVLRKYTLALHLTAAAIAWSIGAAAREPAAAYLVTLVLIWNYRRDTGKSASGWYRLGAGVTAIWLVFGAVLFNAGYSSNPADAETILLGTWIFVALGMLPWLLGWLAQWIRDGFRAKADCTRAAI